MSCIFCNKTCKNIVILSVVHRFFLRGTVSKNVWICKKQEPVEEEGGRHCHFIQQSIAEIQGHRFLSFFKVIKILIWWHIMWGHFTATHWFRMHYVLVTLQQVCTMDCPWFICYIWHLTSFQPAWDCKIVNVEEQIFQTMLLCEGNI